MNAEQIIKYCEGRLTEEELKELPSQERIKTLQEIIGFARNTTRTSDNESDSFKEIWQKHHKAHKGTLYVFGKKDNEEINGILSQIKEEMMLNQQVYGSMTTSQFLDLLLKNCDVFWKDRTFQTWTFNEKFRKILSPVLNGANNRSGQKKKPSYQDVLSKDPFGINE